MLELDSTIAHLCPELRDDERAEGANRLYELLLTMGADASMAKSKVAELYSPPRVTTYIGSLPHVNLEAGMTFDLRVGADGRQWDFLKAEDRARARKLIARDKPFIVIGSPPCTDFSAWNTRLNHKNMRPQEVRRRVAEAETLLGFAIEVYEHQLHHGRHFLHEHPASATSWSVPGMAALRKRKGVGEVVSHLCQFVLSTRSGKGRERALKPTRFLSSAAEVLKHLDKQCPRDHTHQRLAQSRAREAAVYPPELCRAMLRGIEAQRRREGRAHGETLKKSLEQGCAVYALECPTSQGEPEEVVPDEEQTRVLDEETGLAQYAPRRYWDAITNEELPPDLTAASRAEELAFMKEWKVWDVVPISEC
jgi:hypothetical protein